MAINSGGCSGPEYDAATPQAALGSMREMVRDGRAARLDDLIHIEPRDITFDDGVTEASAIKNVIDKFGNMLGRLYRVAKKLREQFPEDVKRELAAADDAAARRGFSIERFLADPFGMMDQESQRVTAEDLGDGSAAVLIDGEPAFGVGVQMRQVDGRWKFDVPIDLLNEYRPNTRHEWSVLASMMLSLENALKAFEEELDEGQFRDLSHASERAGRLLGERAFVQAIIYQGMKDSADSSSSPASGK